ncbi:MAG TPA: hypothetical protein VFR97_05460 [Capillimicrobium sp.]|nr:hypothetical protein [Capillimicrobium sp.]
MKKLVLCGAFAALLVPAAPASAAKLQGCPVNHLAPQVEWIKKKKLSCEDARVVVQKAEVGERVNCRPDEEETIAPFRECAFTAVLSTGQRDFFCRSRWEVPGERKRYYRTRCKSLFGDVVRYRRDANDLP